MRSTLGILLLGFVGQLSPAQAQGEIQYRIEAPAVGSYEVRDSGFVNQRVLPGQAGDLVFSLRNLDNASGNVEVVGRFESRGAAFGGYTFTAADPARCRAPTLDTIDGRAVIVFPVGPLAANERVTCSYQVARDAASGDDLRFRLCGPRTPSFNHFCLRVFRFGTLPDLALAVEPAGPVTAEGQLLRLRMRNPSPSEVTSRVVTTECLGFFAGGVPPPPLIQSDFEGGCASVSGELCFEFTGFSAESYGFALGPAPPGGDASCLVRLLPHSGAIRIYFLGDHMTLANDADGFDVNNGNDMAFLALSAPPVTVPVPPVALLAIAAFLVLAGLATLRTRRRRLQA